MDHLEVRALLSTTVTYPTFVLDPFAGGSGPGGGYTPAQLQTAYGFNNIVFNGTAGTGNGETIAIVDAYDDPNIQSDLNTFDSYFGLPAATVTRVNETGGNSYPPSDPTGGWELEESLDVEWAHAMAPGAAIMLVEASSTSTTDLLDAVKYAAANSNVVSMSWGGSEFSGETADDSSYFDQPGVAFVASSGDSGAPAIWPAVSPNVLSVGGTSLSVGTGNVWSSEVGWSGSGGGPSVYESQPSYQTGVVTQTSTARATPDVAYDASPSTGVAVYDSVPYNGETLDWVEVGGTSEGAPQWSALLAIADQGLALSGQQALNSTSPQQVMDILYENPTDFHDITSGTSTGHPHYSAGTGYDYVTGMGSPVANLVVGSLVNTVSVRDAGFEQVVVGAGHYQYDPTGSPWTFSGNAGISGNNSQFTAGNPPAPQGSQVAFLQSTGSFTQSVADWAAGSYVLTFDAAQRGNHQASQQNFNVLIDGNVVGTFTPSGTSYESYSTTAFTVTAGTHTITFQGLDSAGGDNTAFIDQVAVAPASAVSVGDPGFEQVVVGAGHYQYDPTGSPWTFSGSAGISGNNSQFTAGNPPAPQGSQVAFLQSTGSFTQSVADWAAGSYVLTFDAAQRGNHQASQQNFNVLIDGNVVGTFTPSGTSYESYSTTAFTVTAGTHTVTFQGLDSAGGDNTAFIDDVAVT